MMRRRTLLVAALAAAAATAAPAAAGADSVFGIRGLGLIGRPFSARVSSSGGAFALFDGTSPVNPASLTQVTTTAGWGTFSATNRTFADGPVSSALESTRFPLFGFATPVGLRAVLGVTVSEYLDRTWAVTTSLDTTIRDSTVTVSDVAKSTGGVTDIRVAGAYRLSDAVSVGVGLHAIAGSTRLSIARNFSAVAYTTYSEVATTSFSGVGLSAGITARLGPRLATAASFRVNGRLKATALDGQSATVGLPLEVSAAAIFVPVSSVGLAISAGYQTWSSAQAGLAAAGQPGARNVWNLALGGEVSALHWRGQVLPLRFGYRWRQLPFGIGTLAGSAPLSEHALSAGLGLAMASGRATFDVGVESGSRSAGSASERFTTVFVGLTVRP